MLHFLQQLHLERERPRVLFESDVPDVYRADAADLRRLETTVGVRSDTSATPWDAIVSRDAEGVACTVL